MISDSKNQNPKLESTVNSTQNPPTTTHEVTLSTLPLVPTVPLVALGSKTPAKRVIISKKENEIRLDDAKVNSQLDESLNGKTLQQITEKKKALKAKLDQKKYFYRNKEKNELHEDAKNGDSLRKQQSDNEKGMLKLKVLDQKIDDLEAELKNSTSKTERENVKKRLELLLVEKKLLVKKAYETAQKHINSIPPEQREEIKQHAIQQLRESNTKKLLTEAEIQEIYKTNKDKALERVEKIAPKPLKPPKESKKKQLEKLHCAMFALAEKEKPNGLGALGLPMTGPTVSKDTNDTKVPTDNGSKSSDNKSNEKEESDTM